MPKQVLRFFCILVTVIENEGTSPAKPSFGMTLTIKLFLLSSRSVLNKKDGLAGLILTNPIKLIGFKPGFF